MDHTKIEQTVWVWSAGPGGIDRYVAPFDPDLDEWVKATVYRNVPLP